MNIIKIKITFVENVFQNQKLQPYTNWIKRQKEV